MLSFPSYGNSFHVHQTQSPIDPIDQSIEELGILCQSVNEGDNNALSSLKKGLDKFGLASQKNIDKLKKNADQYAPESAAYDESIIVVIEVLNQGGFLGEVSYSDTGQLNKNQKIFDLIAPYHMDDVADIIRALPEALKTENSLQYIFKYQSQPEARYLTGEFITSDYLYLKCGFQINAQSSHTRYLDASTMGFECARGISNNGVCIHNRRQKCK